MYRAELTSELQGTNKFKFAVYCMRVGGGGEVRIFGRDLAI